MSINTQESSRNSASKIESSQGAKRPKVDETEEETEHPAKKICADPMKSEDEQIVAYINLQAKLSPGNMCNEEASRNVQTSTTSHQTNVAVDLQTTLTCYDQPQEVCTNIMKTDYHVETTEEAPSNNEKSDQLIEMSLEMKPQTSTTCGQLHSDVAQEETDPLPTVVPILFSDDENDAGDSLWNTQLNMEIDKVQTVLKLDKLRRPKKNS